MSGSYWHFLGLTQTLFVFLAGQFALRACTCISELSFGSCLDGRQCFAICPFDSFVIFAIECPLWLISSLNMFRASSYTCENGIASQFCHAAASGIVGAFLRRVVF